MIARILNAILDLVVALFGNPAAMKLLAVRLRVEELEVRTVPTTDFYWTNHGGNGDGNWGTAANWKYANGAEADRAPGLSADHTDDAVNFGSVGTAEDYSCYLNTDAKVFKIYYSGTSTLYLQGQGQNPAAHNLTLTASGSNWLQGTLDGAGNLLIGLAGDPEASTFSWTRGTFQGTGFVKVVAGTQSVMSIDSAFTHTLAREIRAESQSTLTWDRSGQISMIGSYLINIYDQATFDITAAGNASMNGGAVWVENGGTLTVAGGADEPSIFTMNSALSNHGQATFGGWTKLRRLYNFGTVTTNNASRLVLWDDPLHKLSSSEGRGNLTGDGVVEFHGTVTLDGAAGSAIQVRDVDDFAAQVVGLADLQINRTYNWYTSEWLGCAEVTVAQRGFLRISSVLVPPIADHVMEMSLINTTAQVTFQLP